MKPLHYATKAARYVRRNGRYWTPRKIVNAAMASLALRLRLEKTPALPVVIKLEATNICNGTCRLCPVAQKRDGGRGHGMMDWQLFTALIDQLRRSAVVADLTNWGESLLHPRIIDMVRYAHDAGLYTYLSTNLHTVRDEHVEALMTCGLDELTLSLHGLDEDAYQGYQPGFSFAECDALIGRLVEARRRLGRHGKPKMTLNFVVTSLNEHQADALGRYARDRDLQFALSGVSLNLRFDIDRAMACERPGEAAAIIRRAVETWLPKDRRFDRSVYRDLADNPALMYAPTKRFACDWPWRKLVVNWDGGLSACCGSFHAEDDLGRFTPGASIAELWNSPAYRACRASFKPGRAACDGACDEHDDEVICEHCPGVLL